MDHTESAGIVQAKKAGLHRRFYDWTLHWAHTPYGSVALFAIAFTESSFFPIPPDVLLMALAFSRPERSLRYATICSIGSLLGGCFGYFIGYQFFEHIGLPVLNFYGVVDKFNFIKENYNANAFAAVAAAGFTPIPYKVFAIAAGVCKINIWTFILATVISRSGRFFIIAGLVYLCGPRIKAFIDKYFNLLSLVFVILLIAGFFIIKLLN